MTDVHPDPLGDLEARATRAMATRLVQAQEKALVDFVRALPGFRPEDYIWLVTTQPEEPAVVDLTSKETP